MNSLLLALAFAGVLPPPVPFAFHHENVMGTSLTLKIHADSTADADRAEAAALAEIDRLSKILSTYDPQSEVSRFLRTRDRAVPVSAELREVLALFDQWRTRSNGALNASAETISRVWKQAAQRGSMPTREELTAAVAKVRESHWTLHPDGTATHTSDAASSLNTFTKSYVIDRAAREASNAGATGVLINAGGDIAMRGNISDTVGIADPFSKSEKSIETFETNLAVATSGNYRRGYDIGGRHHSHIVDPRTGDTAEHIVSATVVAENPVDAGALATAMSVLDPKESVQMAALYVPAAEYLLIAKDGGRIASRNWYALQAKAAAHAAVRMTIALELARVEGQRYRRPYVAVWIEDQDKFPLRTIALWLEKTRWLPDLRTWHRADRMRALAEGTEIVGSVTSATRSPGKYTLDWDGKDAQGKPLKPGKYTVCIEVAREHGTYQLIRQEVDLNGTPKQIPLKPNPEVASASIDYK
jgi:FAD:protein FMN transferase